EQYVSERIRRERQTRIASGHRSLYIQRTLRMLPAQDGEMIELALILVQRIAGVGALSVDDQRRAIRIQDAGLQAGAIGNLKVAGGRAEHGAQAILVVENVFEIREAVILRGVIVQGLGAAVRRFDSQIVAQEISGHEVVEVSGGAAVVETRLHGAVAAAVQRDRAARIDHTALGLEVD